ncbi:uncharacterized protein LOC108096434 [Drosophila ficusphila]|uniref:uncharacterized protein LOC108096434 n=1 Tax=Drosophila ficusphila TaxID=30025 RepID=UPI0007E6AC2C|nr:uncharacterized protein LOC108096434 [Drosophila ficusphila]
MAGNGEFVLNADCLLEIMKYIIADRNRKLGTPLHNDLINFVLAHEYFLQVFAEQYRNLYKDIERALALRITALLIDLRVNKISKDEKELFWNSYLHTLRDNIKPYDVHLFFYKDKNEGDNKYVDIFIPGMTSIAKVVKLNENISSEILTDICTTIPNLRKLEFRGIDICGSLSDIVPCCKNLEELSIKLNTGIEGAQYAPLAIIPTLKNITITGVQECGSELQFFKDLRKWHRPKNLPPLTLTIVDYLSDSNRSFMFVTFASLRKLLLHCSFLGSTTFKAEYDVYELWKESNLIEEDIASITLCQEEKIEFDWFKGELNLNIDPELDIANFAKLPNLQRLVLRNANLSSENEKNMVPLANFLRIMAPKRSCSLKSCRIEDIPLDRLNCKELGRIESIQFLKCDICDWDSIKELTQLTNLQHLMINVMEPINFNTSKLIFNLLNICQVQADIFCSAFHIIFWKIKNRLRIQTATGYQESELQIQIEKCSEPGSLNQLFDEFSASNLLKIEELEITNSNKLPFEYISKLAEVQTIKKLICDPNNLTGIEKLANLSNLEDMTINSSTYSMDKNDCLSLLLKNMEAQNSIQCINLTFLELTSKEVFSISKIRSLKKLRCKFSDMKDFQSLSELANSSIEELIVLDTVFPILNLLTAFSLNRTTKLQKLEFVRSILGIEEVSEISKIKRLAKLRATFENSECVQVMDQLACLEHLIIDGFEEQESPLLEQPLKILAIKSPITLQKLELSEWIGATECKYLTQIETLESLNCNLRRQPGIEVLANIKRLTKLFIKESPCLQFEAQSNAMVKLYQSLAFKSDSMLEELQTQVNDSVENCEISKIKSLQILKITYNEKCNNISDLGQLSELKSLHILENYGSIDCHSLLSIFQSCQNLDFATFEFKNKELDASFIDKVSSILKSSRDPVRQRPLKLHLIEESTFPSFHLKDIDAAYMNISYAYKPEDMRIFPDDGEEGYYDYLDSDDLDFDDWESLFFYLLDI